jgi:hypothetical protein
MRKLYFLLLLFMVTVAAQGQTVPPADPYLEKRDVEGFTVYLVSAPQNTYLFEIIRKELPFSLSPNKLHPVTLIPKGFPNKEDAYKVAGWMIGEHQKTGLLPPFVPPHVVRELNLSQDTLTQN